VTHVCPMTNDAHFNKEGFLDSPTEDDVVRVQCLDFDVYCGICNEIYKEAVRDAAEEMSHEPPEEDEPRWEIEQDTEQEAGWEEAFPIEVDEI